MIPQLLKDLPTQTAVSVYDLPGLGIFKLPRRIYQVLFDVGLQKGSDGQEQAKEILLDYIHEKYPGKTLNQFIDLSTEECKHLQHLVRGLDWGLYFTLTNKTLIT